MSFSYASRLEYGYTQPFSHIGLINAGWAVGQACKRTAPSSPAMVTAAGQTPGEGG